MKSKNWIVPILLTICLIAGLFSVPIYEHSFLDECAKDGKAVIVDKYSIRKRGDFMVYRYRVEEEEYTVHESIFHDFEVKAFQVGDTIDIRIACSKPSISRYKNLEE